MFLSKQTLFILSSLLYAATAATVPKVPEAPEGLVVLAQESVDDGAGVLIFYGDADPAAAKKRDESGLSKRCGSNQVSCFGSHRAPIWLCSALLYQLEISSTQLQESPRSICKQASSKQCCVSWAHPVSGGKKDNLAPAGYKVNSECNWGDNTVSGLTRDTQIGNTCTTQCLSNRPDGCE
ncbi:hypothetical protein FOMG_07635 [Fusarium oxysporum f. sp. melonis 26406]|uniref:WD-like domain-containing protein n=1 Tax=Fusarium oxysporum f. sp. melonis 26406 TaxID=1089452 RepID=X0B6Y2_FUSOX|nr:hypothetical protein FOMG_07635 [Fusarium oxysporum f. sp. melonis 26406]